MAAPYTQLASKLEAAMKSLVDALALTGVTVNRGIDDAELAAPYVVIVAKSAGEEVFLDSGIEQFTAEVRVASAADAQSLSDHTARVGQVFDVFRDDAIAASLSAAASDFHCYQVVKAGENEEVSNRKLINTLVLDCAVCGSDLA